MGLLGYLNEVSLREFDVFEPVLSNDLVSMFFNCHSRSKEEVLSKPIARDLTEISFSQNLFDSLGLPHELHLDYKTIMAEEKYQEMSGKI